MSYPSDSPTGGRPVEAPGGATPSKRGRYLTAAALLGGGVTLGAVFSPIGLAGAETVDDTADEPTGDSSGDAGSVDDAPTDGRRGDGAGHHRHRLGPRVDELAEMLGLSGDELRAELEAGNSLADIAVAQGVTTDELLASMLAAVEAHLDEAVADGKVDEATAAERLAAAEERLPELIEQTPGEGFWHSHRHGHRHGHGHGFVRGSVEALEELGISTEELRAGREAGMTLAEIAAEQGVAEDDLVAVLVDEAVERVDAAVEAGKVDADRAAEMKANAEDRIGELIDREPGDRDGHRHPHRHGGRGGADGGETEDTSLETT